MQENMDLVKELNSLRPNYESLSHRFNEVSVRLAELDEK